jgi:hypothetical protein
MHDFTSREGKGDGKGFGECSPWTCEKHVHEKKYSEEHRAFSRRKRKIE